MASKKSGNPRTPRTPAATTEKRGRGRPKIVREEVDVVDDAPAAPRKSKRQAKELYFAWRKDTSGTHVYDQVTEDGDRIDTAAAIVPTMYIRKSAIKGKRPDGFLMTLTPQ